MMKLAERKQIWRQIRASWRDTLLLFREFRRPLIFYVLLLLGSGSLYHYLSMKTENPVGSWVESVFFMLMLTFLQASGDFPNAWYLQVFFFIIPLFGLAIIAQGLTEFGVSLFNRRARSKEWEMAVASTFNNHIVLIGLGHLGYRVTCKLHDLEQDLVVIEQNPNKDLVGNIRALGIPVIEDDGSREMALVAAGVPLARTIILCTQNDALNLKMALKARNLNPEIEVIIRIFEEDFAEALQKQFGFKAFSATGMAAPIFAASASKIDISSPITINGVSNSLAKLIVDKSSPLVGQTVQQIEDDYNLSLVFLHHGDETDMHPSASVTVSAGDTIAVLGVPDQITQLVHRNHH